MRVLFFQRWFGVRYGGTETHIEEMARRFTEMGHEVHLLTLEGAHLKDLPLKVSVWTVSKTFGENLFSYDIKDPRLYFYTALYAIKAFLVLLKFKLRRMEFDVVSVHFFTEALLMRVFRWLFGWPYVYFLEGYTDHEAFEARYAHLQIANSETVIRKCYEKFGYKPLLGYVGADTNRFRPDGRRVSFGSDRIVIFSVSRLAPQKNLQILLEVARIVCNRDPRFLFVIGGEGSERKRLEYLIQRYALEENVKLLGRIPWDLLPLYYRSADIFAVTEFPPDEMLITAIEAMSSGLPVVATSPTRRFEVLGNCGVLATFNPSDFAEKLWAVVRDEKLRETMRKRGLVRSKLFSWDRLARLREKQYQIIAQKKLRSV